MPGRRWPGPVDLFQRSLAVDSMIGFTGCLQSLRLLSYRELRLSSWKVESEKGLRASLSALLESATGGSPDRREHPRLMETPLLLQVSFYSLRVVTEVSPSASSFPGNLEILQSPETGLTQGLKDLYYLQHPVAHR